MLSVVIPAYNNHDELLRCLASIARQTMLPDEVLVVDDGSRVPISPELVEGAEFHSLRQARAVTKIIRQNNAGAAAARNRGFNASHGDLVYFCDADVTMQPMLLAKLHAALIAHPEASYAYCSFRYGWKTFRLFPFDEKRLRQMPYIPSMILIRREHFPGFDESLKRFQDWDLALTMLAHGHTGVLVPEALYHVSTGGSMSAWLPSFAYRFLPWLSRVKQYEAAKAVIRTKHKLPNLTPTLSLQERGARVDLSIVIVSWNVRDLLARCLASIEKGRGDSTLETLIVDNASHDGTGEWLLQEGEKRKNQKEKWTIIANDTNRGFAAACNQAIARATGRYILLLNPDTECIEEGAFEKMIAFMNDHPRCGILGSKLIGSDGQWQPSVRRFPTARALIFGSLGKKNSRVVRQYLADDVDPNREQTVDQVMGACFLIRRELLDAIGSLDERFFIWFEEVDLCFRAHEAGWEVWYTPSVVFRHHGGTSFAQVATVRKQWMFGKSATQYFWKRGMMGSAFLTAAAIPVRMLASALRHLPSPARRG